MLVLFMSQDFGVELSEPQKWVRVFARKKKIKINLLLQHCLVIESCVTQTSDCQHHNNVGDKQFDPGHSKEHGAL